MAIRKFTSEIVKQMSKVSIDAKQPIVNDFFSVLYNDYDTMCDLYSLGMHRLWKTYFVNNIGSLEPIYGVNGPTKLRVIDVAGGTADISVRLIEASKHTRYYRKHNQCPISVDIVDINKEMLNLGVAKLKNAGVFDNVTTHLTDANNLTQFGDNLFDIYLISFGLRNIPNYQKTIAESYRVLKPHGKIFAMELSKIQSADFHRMFKLYSSAMSEVVFKNISSTFEQQKEYVEDTMDAFPSQEELRAQFIKSGYKNVSYENLLNGVACIYQANK